MKLQDIFNDNLIITLDELKSDAELVRQIEIRLRDLGLLDSSEIDGIWKSATETALTEFCRLAFLNNMETGLFGRTFAKKLIEMPNPVPIPSPNIPNNPVTINLSGSVGARGNNNPDDVKAVKDRLVDLGYNWVGRNSTVENETIRTIKLFQAIISGKTTVSGVDGRIDVNQTTHKFLQARNAPRWQEMPLGNSRNQGFVNFDHQQGDNTDFGTNWMIDTIQEAGKLYIRDHRNSNPNSAPISTNNLTNPRGGKTRPHQTHQTGLSVDLLLPKKNGTFGGITFRSGSYDSDAMEAMLRAVNQQNKYKIRVIFFNDLEMVAKDLCQNLNDGGIHDNHAHVDILPPSAN